MLGLENDHPDRYALNLLNIILGGNMSSRLFDEVREKRGLAYSISSSLKYLKDTGMFMIRAGVDNKKLVKAVDVILKELKKIRHSGVTEDEFRRSRDYYLGQILLGLEDTLDHMLWIGESVLMRDRIRTLEEIIRLVKKVKREDIRRVANDILKENRFNLAVVGPMDKSQDQALRDLMGVP
jgi:predicted Zn-dependent peptidase